MDSAVRLADRVLNVHLGSDVENNFYYCNKYSLMSISHVNMSELRYEGNHYFCWVFFTNMRVLEEGF